MRSTDYRRASRALDRSVDRTIARHMRTLRGQIGAVAGELDRQRHDDLTARRKLAAKLIALVRTFTRIAAARGRMTSARTS